MEERNFRKFLQLYIYPGHKLNIVYLSIYIYPSYARSLARRHRSRDRVTAADTD